MSRSSSGSSFLLGTLAIIVAIGVLITAIAGVYIHWIAFAVAAVVNTWSARAMYGGRRR